MEHDTDLVNVHSLSCSRSQLIKQVEQCFLLIHLDGFLSNRQIDWQRHFQSFIIHWINGRLCWLYNWNLSWWVGSFLTDEQFIQRWERSGASEFFGLVEQVGAETWSFPGDFDFELIRSFAPIRRNKRGHFNSLRKWKCEIQKKVFCVALQLFFQEYGYSSATVLKVIEQNVTDLHPCPRG